ncbi:MAG: shikimate kinase [Lachnospiraceae bacterium]|nr:shikimate kinase [Lachnospiraceae bacterium]
MKNGNVILIGMPASGKSTVGVILAKVLGMNFIDTDIVIQHREGTKLNLIIDKKGIDAFMKCEEEAILATNVSNTVISTGGSAVYSAAAMEHLKRDAVVVYLKVGLRELKRRLGNFKERGIVIKPGETLEGMYKARSVLYEKYADITVGENGASIEDTVTEIKRRL